MKKYALDFMRRGLIALGFGPLVLAVIYFILNKFAGLETLSVDRVCTGIISISLLSFIAGAMNFVYHIERLPLMVAILIHGAALYLSYLLTYLVNGWLEQNIVAFLVFTSIFVFGFILIWLIIYVIIRNNTEKINRILKEKQSVNT
jgi:hypothetical protein